MVTTRIGDIDLELPAGWEDHSLYSFVAPAEQAVATMRAKQAPTFRKNVVLQRRVVGSGATLDDCVKRARDSTARDFGAVSVEIDDGPSAAGTPTKRLVYKVVDQVTHQPVAQVVYVALLRGTEWQIAFSVPAMAVDDAVPAFEAVVRSIRVA